MIKLENLFIAIYGLTTVLVFLIMVIYGGLFNSIHTLLFREVSFLISPYSLTQEVTTPLYKLYNINLFLFSIVLFLRLKNIFAKIGALYLTMSAVTGLLLLQIPMDPILLAQSETGLGHLIITLLTGFYIMIAMLLFGYSFKKNKNLTALSNYSFAISLFILIAGFFTGVFAIYSMPNYVGFTQKLPLIAFLVWILLTAVWMLKSDKRVRYTDNKKRKK